MQGMGVPGPRSITIFDQAVPDLYVRSVVYASKTKKKDAHIALLLLHRLR